MKSPEAIKDEMMLLMEAYYDAKFKEEKQRDFVEGSRIPYAKRVFDQEEMKNALDATLSFWLTSGKYNEKFERDFGKFLQVPYCYTCNSGSSANLLAFMTLTSKLLGKRRIRRGDEVITVAASFPTTIAPIVQYGAVPVFIDIQLPSYNIDWTQLEQARSNKTKAVMVAHTLGNPFNLKEVKAFCNKYQLWLIEDNCDALGSQYEIEGEWRYTGTWGDIGTSSFYPPHHMTMGEGGAVYTHDPLLAKIMLSLRDWGRDCCCPSGVDNCCGKRFNGQHGDLPFGYDHKYVYAHFGYNLKITDLQAAIGCAQLMKLPYFIEARRAHWLYLRKALEVLEDVLILPKEEEAGRASWFGFLIGVKRGGAVTRNGLVQYLEEQGIQTRMLFSGNITKHPCFKGLKEEPESYRIIGQLENTDFVMEQGFWIGVYPGMTEVMLSYMVEQIKLYISKVKSGEEKG